MTQQSRSLESSSKSSRSLRKDSHESSSENSSGKYSADLCAEIEHYNKQKKLNTSSGSSDAIQNETGKLLTISETIQNAYDIDSIELIENSGKFYSNTPTVSGEVKFDIDALGQLEGEEQKNLTESTPIHEYDELVLEPPFTNQEDLKPDKPVNWEEKLWENKDLSDKAAKSLNKIEVHIKETGKLPPTKGILKNAYNTGGIESTAGGELNFNIDAPEQQDRPRVSFHERPKVRTFKDTEAKDTEVKGTNAFEREYRGILKLDNTVSWGEKLWENNDLLDEATKSFNKIEEVDIQKLVSRDTEELLVNKINSGSEMFHTEKGYIRAQTALATTDGDLLFDKRLKTHLENYLVELGEEKESIIALQKPFLAIDSTMKKYDKAHAIVEETPDSTSNAHTYKMRQQIGTSNDKYLKRSSEYIDKINTAIENTKEELQKVTKEISDLETHVELLSRFGDHPVFAKEDIRPAKATTEIVSSGGRPGTGELTTIKTLLNAQGIRVTDQRLAQTLGKDWWGNINLTNLETKLRSLGDKKGLQLREIELKDLKTASSKRPMGALLYNTSWLGLRGPSLTVGVERVEWNRRTAEWDVVILDEHRPISYKISYPIFADVWSKQGIIPTVSSQESGADQLTDLGQE